MTVTIVKTETCNVLPILNSSIPGMFTTIAKYLSAGDICDLLTVNKNLYSYLLSIEVIESLFERFSAAELGIGPKYIFQILKQYAEKKSNELVILRNLNPCYPISPVEGKNSCIRFVAFRSITNM